MANNPSRPFDSPIKVTNAGGWEPNQWIHEASKGEPKLKPVKDLSVYAETEIIDKGTKVIRTKITDKALEQAVKKDLKTKGIQ